MNSKVTALKFFAFNPRKVFGSNFTVSNRPGHLSVYQAHSKPETKMYKGTKEGYYSRIIHVTSMPLYDLSLPSSLATSLLTSYTEHFVVS